MKKLMAFLKDEDGLETDEYAIILGHCLWPWTIELIAFLWAVG